jgi:hypothetical protein
MLTSDPVLLQVAGSEGPRAPEEQSQLTETLPAGDTHHWPLVAIFIDRLLFLFFVLVYLFVSVRYFV